MSSYLKPQQKIRSDNSLHLPIVIIGNGPVGIKAANFILETTLNLSVVIYGEEKSKPYNRVQLSLFLAGKISEAELDNPILSKENDRIIEHIGRRIVNIDRANKTVTDHTGQTTQYSKLILALGSSPKIPKLDNIHLHGVHQFRTIECTNELLKSKRDCQNIYIVGSGPLGLETAFAMKQPNNNVTLQVREQLLSTYFNADAQQVLMDYIVASGIKISIQNPIKKIIGKSSISQIETVSGDMIICDCLIFCTGIKPNIWLAEKINLKTNHGIIVNEYMLTNDKSIYAIGECSEFHEKTYGVVSPGFKQAKACVGHISGNLHEFKEELPHVQVKFNDYTTAYYGEMEIKNGQYFTYTNRLKGIYRKLILRENRLVGVVLVGNWSEESEIKICVNENKLFHFKALKQFEKTGLLINKPDELQVKNLPEDYVICLCQNVTQGELSKAIQSGCRTIEKLGERTKAGTVCGSCKPLLANLLDKPAPNLVMRHQKAIYFSSIIAILLILMTVFFEPLGITGSVQMQWQFEKLWFDNFWKQVSGYTLLSLCLIACALILRKRWSKFNFGHVDSWRYVHSIIGIVALLVLMIHTGMRMGSNLNFALMAIFLSATITGSLVGVFMSKSHHWSDHKLRTHRLWWSRIHYTLLWTLLPLLIFHIILAYYF